MVTKLSSGQPAIVQGQHTSGIFADMTVDGPEIGTLVLIVDRAKNLPNRKAMGKQNPYCAARLGKEAKKTDTDRRGGQTPRWDQELRFTVHDSLDYHNMKVSVFSEDKKTDLIGEAWVNLDNVITPGGGKNDLWQSLNCKGKYAGEIRIELTYYDSRPKPEKRVAVPEQDIARQSSNEKIKRRPLPSGGRSQITPDTIPEPLAPGRARHGPRDFRTPPRANSLPPETIPQSTPQRHQQDVYASSPGHYQEDEFPIPIHAEYQDKYTDYNDQAQYAQPDFLPSLPPLAPRRTPQDRPTGVQSTPPAVRPPHLGGLPHAHSDPVIPQRDDFHHGQDQLYTAAPEPLADLDYQHHYVQQRQRDEYHDQQYYDEQYDTPPRPPNHSRTSSALPSPYTPPEHNLHRYATEPAQARPRSRGQPQYVSNSSPLQSIERGMIEPYSSPLQPTRSHEREYGSSPLQPVRPERYDSSPRYDTSPRSMDGRQSYDATPDGSPLPYRTSAGRSPYQQRHSVASLIQPQRQAHPLSQEVPRARSPLPNSFRPTTASEVEQYRNDADRNAIIPIVRPRAISPARQEQPERRKKSTYSIQNPVRAFESSDSNPLSTTNRLKKEARTSTGQPRFSDGVPFSPDSFDMPAHSPGWQDTDAGAVIDKSTITGWDGREIDPSDHLPVASWAPEPESKTPNKTYGLGRDRDFGPRSAEPAARLGKDVVVNVHRRGQSAEPSSNTIKARLVKKNASASSPISLPREQSYSSIPDPYAQQEYSSGFTGGSPASPGQGRYDDMYGQHYNVPSVPPKVPMEYGHDALSREIASIDIGAGSRARAPAPTAYVPVRSHRDRNSFY